MTSSDQENGFVGLGRRRGLDKKQLHGIES
jgi:hypothetical protein